MKDEGDLVRDYVMWEIKRQVDWFPIVMDFKGKLLL